jgi:hypothetical protein
MATELLRYVGHDTTTKRPAKYRAPSFSWASVDGAVIPGEWQEGDILVEVLNASAEVETSNPFGSVDSGSVRLRGTLKLALLGLNLLLRQGITFPRRPKACLPTANRRPNMGTRYTYYMVAKQHWVLQVRAPNEPNRIELWLDSNSIRSLRII